MVQTSARLLALLSLLQLRREWTGHELAQRLASIRPDSAPLVTAFVRAEFDRLGQSLNELGYDGEMIYEGEDRDWLLSLTRTVRRTLDATSIAAVGFDGKASFDGGFWDSDLGRRYLDLQRAAIARGVKVRRIFFVERAKIEHDADFLRMCLAHTDIGVDVRVLPIAEAALSTVTQLHDLVLFDNALSYDVAQEPWTAGPAVLHTRLRLRPDEVARRVVWYRDLWNMAHAFVI